MNPALSWAFQQTGGAPAQKIGKSTKTHQFSETWGGYLPNTSVDPNATGSTPEGAYGSYKFDKDGNIMGSLDGKTFSPIDGLKLNVSKLNGEGAPSAPKVKSDRLADALYGHNINTKQATQGGNAMAQAFANGGLIKDFKVGKDGQLLARISGASAVQEGAAGPAMPAGAALPEWMKKGQGGSALTSGRLSNTFEGYIPIEGYQLEDSGDGNLRSGRSAFFGPDGLVSLTAATDEELSGVHVAYSRKKGSGPQPQQALKQADKVNLKTGTRGGG